MNWDSADMPKVVKLEYVSCTITPMYCKTH